MKHLNMRTFKHANIKTREEDGFTLVEMIVVVALLSIVGLIAVEIFFTSLRGSTKTEILKEIKQNGGYAITTMEIMIRNAQGVVSSCSGVSGSITIENSDGNDTTFQCDWHDDVAKIASVSGATTRRLTSKNVSLAPPGTPPGCTASTLQFTCSSSPGKPETVAIQFTLNQRSSATRPEERASATFETTVSLRTYQNF